MAPCLPCSACGKAPGLAVLLTAVLAAGPTSAQSLALAGSMGAGRALLMIDGQAQVLSVGATARGITLQRLGDGVAQVRVAGQLHTLHLGAAALRLGADGTGTGAAPAAAAPASRDTPQARPAGGPAAPAASDGRSIVLPMGPGGHFGAQGTINGRSVQFMVDTGATTVALSQAEANRIGLDWRGGRPLGISTANGTVPGHALTLSSVRIGTVELANVAAVVVPAEMPAVLLGNSFLNRFTMQRHSDVMRLEKKP